MRSLKIVGIIMLSLLVSGLVHADAGITLTDAPPPTYTFGEALTFRISAQSEARIKSVTLFYRATATDTTRLGKPRFTPGSAITATYSISLTTDPLPAFTSIEYWWEIQDSADHTLTTDKQIFRYEDNRFEWRTLSQTPLAVHWYQGDTAFGQTALDIATAGLAEVNHDLNAPLPDQLDIYLYANDADARDALKSTGVAWANGHADPALGVVVVTAPPDTLDTNITLAMLIPHELTHVLVYRVSGAQYSHLPTWLNEGLAVLYQAQPNPNFPGALNQARKNGTLIKLDALCGALPTDAGQAELAYAESESVVRYIRDKHGASSLSALLAAYADGVNCEGGVQRALGQSLSQLEEAWLRDKINLDPSILRLSQLTPWLAVASLIVFSGGLYLALTLRLQPRAR